MWHKFVAIFHSCSEKFQSRQSWSLMGGLIFNPPGKYQGEPNSAAFSIP